jgi:hypothetical protein
MSRYSSLLLSCIILLAGLSIAHADDLDSGSGGSSGGGHGRYSLLGYDYTKRAENREKGRWSLSDWLALKEKNRLMDMWLSTNSPSPFEFMLGGAYNSITTETTGSSVSSNNGSKAFSAYNAEVSAYAQFVGLTGEYENNSAENYSDLAGMFNLRILGNSLQNTSLTLHYGLRTRDIIGTQATRLSQQFGQASLQLYISKYFGIDGKYRYYLPTTDSVMGDVNETLVTGGVFIDFKGLRVYGQYFKEEQKSRSSSATTDTVTDRSGIQSGIKIFF